jgi:histidyl-tRNA synthetase
LCEEYAQAVAAISFLVHFSGTPVPAVGVSIGIERIFTILEELETAKQGKIRATQTQVGSANTPDMLPTRFPLIGLI